MKMPWGKYKGQPLEDLPDGYIRWLLENLTDLPKSLEQELENQLVLREGQGVVRVP